MEVKQPLQQLLHDLRAPIARAKTCAKLLAESEEENDREELGALLLESLELLDSLLVNAESRFKQ